MTTQELLKERERIIHDLMSAYAEALEMFVEAFYRVTDNMIAQKPGLRGRE